MNSSVDKKLFFRKCQTLFVILTMIQSAPVFAIKVVNHSKTFAMAQDSQKPPSPSNSSIDKQFERVLTPRFRSWEVRTSPLALLAKWITLDVSHRWTGNISAGFSGIFYNAQGPGGMFFPTYNGYAIGGLANYYFNGHDHSGFYLGSHAYYESFKNYPHAFLGYEERKGIKVNAVAGYQWSWSRVNLLGGLGGEYRNHQVATFNDENSGIDLVTPDSTDSIFALYIEAKLGFSF